MAQKKELPKSAADKIGRNINLVYNQAAMYHPAHPAVTRSVAQLHAALSEGFKKISPIVFSMNQDQFFIEDEPIDHHINTSRLAEYFTKTGIQSIAFERRLTLDALQELVATVFNVQKAPKVDTIKKILGEKGLKDASVNYVIYKKVTQDEEIVLRERLQRQLSASDDAAGMGLALSEGGQTTAPDGEAVDLRRPVDTPSTEDVLGMMMTTALSESFEKQFSISALLENPGDLSGLILQTDKEFSEQHQVEGGSPGPMIVKQLHRIQSDVARNAAEVDLRQLARGVFDLKRELLKGMEARKALGVIYANEQEILTEAENLSDAVLVRLVRSEYESGGGDLTRLARIVMRVIPEPAELKRLLPKLREALLAAGMPMAEYYRLIMALKDVLQSEDLAQILDKYATEIGLEGDTLIQEIKQHPGEAAELIYLASEIRKGTKDKAALKEILVQYVEQVSGQAAVDAYAREEKKDAGRLQDIYAKARNDVMDALKKQEIDADMLRDMEHRIMDRMEENLQQLKSEMVLKQLRSGEPLQKNKAVVSQFLGARPENAKEIKRILDLAKAAAVEKGVSPDQVADLYHAVLALPAEKSGGRGAPRRTLARSSSLFILDSEIRRAKRYKTPFSTLSLSIVKISPKKPVAQGLITREDVMQAVMADLADIVRDTDIVGMGDAKMILVIQPMTNKEESRKSLNRVLAQLKKREFVIKEIPCEIHFACVSTAFDPESGGELQDYMKIIQRELAYMAKRLSNIQSFM